MDTPVALAETPVMAQAHPFLNFNTAMPQAYWEEREYNRQEADRQLPKREIIHGLLDRLPEMLHAFYPNGRRNGNTYLLGNIKGDAGQSLKVSLEGSEKGCWYDFDCPSHKGGVLDLFAASYGWDTKNKSDFPKILRSAQEWLGVIPRSLPKVPGQTQNQKQDQTQNKDWGVFIKSWFYRDIDGAPNVRVCRYEKDGKKSFRPFDLKANRYGCPSPRPLYNLPGIAKADVVVFVEGEKCADALITLGICATTAMSGASAPPDKTDWSPLSGKHVLVWPDHDTVGKEHADRVIDKLKSLGLSSLALMVIPENKPEKWDAADAVAEGMDVRVFMDNCSHMVPLSEAETTTQPVEQGPVTQKEEWLDPLPIKTELLPVEPFDLTLMPDPLREFVKDCSFRMQCPPDYIAVSMIFMFGGLIGAACGIKPKQFDDWVVVPNLWGGIIGDPSTLKTPAINEAFDPLHKIEKEAIEEHQEKSKEWESRDKVSKLREDSVKSSIKSQMKNKYFSDEEALELYASQVKEIPKPSCRRYKTNDTTIEKAHELLSQNPRGLIHYRDELVGLITGWGKDGHESDRTFYLEAWNGYGSFTLDRIGRGTVHVENICMAIFGSTQPDKILAYIHRSLHALENDGLLQRFQLLVYPDPLKEWQYVDQLPEQEAKATFHNLAYQVAQMDFFDKIHDLQEAKGKKCFSFDDEGQEVFIEWLTDFEKKLKAHDEPIIIQHLAKYRKLMPALALIFHIITIADRENKTGKITKESVVRAICWCEYLESHARRIYGMALDISAQGASILSKKIRQGELGQKFSSRDVYRKQWSFLKDRDSAEAACEELIKNYWIKEVSSVPAFRQKAKTEYVVNPKIEIETRRAQEKRDE
jgi:DNA primase